MLTATIPTTATIRMGTILVLVTDVASSTEETETNYCHKDPAPLNLDVKARIACCPRRHQKWKLQIQVPTQVYRTYKPFR